MSKAWQESLAGLAARPTTPWELWSQGFDYAVDAAQRSILFWDTMRQRGINYRVHKRKGQPPLLHFDYETVLDARKFPRPVNYALLKIVPPEGVVVPLRRVVHRVHARFMHEGGVVVEPSVTAWITTRRGEDDWSAQLEPLAELAVTVAARLDAGDVTGPLVRELRSTLLELRRGEDGADAFELLAAELSAAVRDSQD